MGEIVLLIIAALFILTGLAYLVPRAWAAFVDYRGKRILTCPETSAPVGVEVDALHAAATAALHGDPELRLATCSRWPEREACGQECLTQIEDTPKLCLVRTILSRWYAGTTCALCGRPVGEIHWADHKPAFLGPGRAPLAWTDVPIENLPGVLATHERICWNCYVVESFRAKHPDLVVEDPRPAQRPEQPAS